MYYEEVTGGEMQKQKNWENKSANKKKKTPPFNSLAGKSIKKSFIDTKKYY